RLLACTNRRSASSKPMRSVKVPPISMATTSTRGDSSAPHPKACAAPWTRSGFQRCAGLPHRASHGQALENQRYFGKRQGPQETANADVANGCGNDLFAACGGAAQEANYPSKPVTIIVPAAPGGVTDQLGRTLAQRFTEAWGQQVIVENKPG